MKTKIFQDEKRCVELVKTLLEQELPTTEAKMSYYDYRKINDILLDYSHNIDINLLFVAVRTIRENERYKEAERRYK